MSTHLEMNIRCELCHWEGQLTVGLRVDRIWPCKPPQICAKLGTPGGSTTHVTAKCAAAPEQTCLERFSGILMMP